MNKSNFLRNILPIAAGTAIFFTFNYLQKPLNAQITNVHLTMGNPTNANTSFSNFLLSKVQYATSHNCFRGTPNWVSWQLNQSWLGSAPRQDDFRADTTLPSGCYRVTSSDYTGSGFDRGHMAPSADRTNTIANNSATFLMTNIIPQAPDNNQGIWANLENYSRNLVTGQNRELYIISGAYGTGGTGSNQNNTTTIAGGKVTVPARTYKVIVVLDRPGLGVSGVTTNTRVIAVDIPNTQGVRNADWRNYRISVDTLEARLRNATGTTYDFLSNVPTSIQSVIEARVDNL
ncbi:DNA/RNA non-specific endonuclease (plasmid) [Anabaena sp. FACHB-709]|uniref:Endonuclease n=1 Tax=Anabaena cylindrica FACHB-318 TaxID=2692880 RepID=A0ABR7ZST0_ANACY|nr:MULTISPECIES: DNA/RNA non-specific endonuclease [Nostocaceae]MBD2175268.1 DNA/RNA non-specific endonuclease [Anabaena cylindrica FACHB-318]MBD2267160.1 DNA/RNA non-specific endonuclease [Anabaena sp. FACHB-709]MBD2276712.1 DNA/RNA non-specific endonuclease [Nostoc sp. PCC 7120 = FACHB-418]MBD2287199.1 DNA/RNA non-specific endonuclease [Anabaena cylindrica FACHB-170]RUR72181.1 nuclease [Nostoc sp. PCC 7120 = FACHB-418]